MTQPDTVGVEAFSSLVKDNDENSEYYFESDPLALKGNSDYQQLIQTLVKLQAQRTKAVKVNKSVRCISLHIFICMYVYNIFTHMHWQRKIHTCICLNLIS